MDKETFIPNSYQTPNAYCDRLMYLLTPAEWKVLSYAVRRIFGFQKRQDNISLSQFDHGTVSTISGEHLDHGTGLSRPTVIACLETLMRYRLITKLADNDPVKNEGDLYSLQLDYDLVDYAGLIERANRKASSNLQRTAAGRNSAEQKRLSLPLDLPSQSDLPGVVNGIDQGWSMGLTRGGQSDLPGVVNGIDRGVVNGIDPQYTEETAVKNQIEIQAGVDSSKDQKTEKGISHPDFDRACAYLKENLSDDYMQAAPVLLEVDEKPNRMLVKLAALPAGFIDAFKFALSQAARRSWSVSFETPSTGREYPYKPIEKPERAGRPASNPDDSITRPLPGHKEMTPEMAWSAALGELQLEMTRATFDTWIKPTVLLSVNGSWLIGTPSKYSMDWLDGRIYPTIKRILSGIVGQPVDIEFVVMRNNSK